MQESEEAWIIYTIALAAKNSTRFGKKRPAGL